jgi:hypothetical protein
MTVMVMVMLAAMVVVVVVLVVLVVVVVVVKVAVAVAADSGRCDVKKRSGKTCAVCSQPCISVSGRCSTRRGTNSPTTSRIAWRGCRSSSPASGSSSTCRPRPRTRSTRSATSSSARSSTARREPSGTCTGPWFVKSSSFPPPHRRPTESYGFA